MRKRVFHDLKVVRRTGLLLAFSMLGLCPGIRAEVFRAGAATADITPEPGVSLDGPISKNGPVKAIHDRLHARALVLDDGTSRVALVICDACMIGRDVVDAAKRQIEKECGIPFEHQLLAATHTHAAVRAVHIGTEAIDDRYHEWLSRQIAAAVQTATQNLAPARIGYASFQKSEMIRCRRFLCEPGSVGENPFGETGERIKSVAGRSSQVIEPAGPVDPQFSVVSVQHLDGAPLAVLGSFSVHYCGGYQRGTVSADYFGHYAASLEQKLSGQQQYPPFVGMMFNGTSGNTGAIQGDGSRYPPFEWMKVSARILAADTIEALESIEYRVPQSLAVQYRDLSLGVRRPSRERLAWARRILATPKSEHPHAWSTTYAQEAEYLDLFPAQVVIPLQAIRIGRIAIASAPCEVFAETGLAIKQASPFSQTFTIELANGYGGYLPPAEQHRLGGYESWPARSSFLELEAETKIRRELIHLLRQLD